LAQSNQLTPAQETLLQQRLAEWLQVGLCCEPADRAEAEAAITELYVLTKRSAPRFVWTLSPHAAIELLEKKHEQRDLWRHFGGQHEVHWLAIHNFCVEIGIEYDAEMRHSLKLWSRIARSVNWWWPADDEVVIVDRPELCRMAGEPLQLHCDDGPAIRFRDGWALWALRGIRMSQRYVETPAAELPVKWWLEEKNVELRHELERKIGAARLLRELNTSTLEQIVLTIDGEALVYELQELSLERSDSSDRDRRVLLAMTNPSTGESHREWVPPTIKSCREALTWRNGWEEMPERIS